MPGLKPGEHFGGTFYGRLVLAELAVVAALVGAVAGVAALIWPQIFHLYLVENGPLESAEDVVYAEAAFTSSMWIALGLAVLVAAVVAVALGVVMVRPLRRQLTELGTLARDVAAGDYTRRLDSSGAGDEVRLLADSFNAMAAKLGEAEASRQALLADLAHELRTPISSISVTLEALADGVLPSDDSTIGSLAEQTDRLTRLATDLRDIADAEGGLSLHREVCEVCELLLAARAAAAEGFARSGVGLEVMGTASGTVWADPQRVAQVLANLLSNALRHTHAQGHVVLAARACGDGWVLSVTDDGDGIDAVHLPHIFERFYRSDAARARDAGGSGIGLAVSAEIARAHGGRLTAASDGLECGSVFELTLPRPSAL
jgi:two-component system, OmpR family, sensor histidine kinase BaeS